MPVEKDLQILVDSAVNEIVTLTCRVLAADAIKVLNTDQLKQMVDASLRRFTSDNVGVTPPPIVKTADETLVDDILIDL